MTSTKPEPQIIQSFFTKTLVDYCDAIEAMTDLYDDGKTPDEELLNQHVARVSRYREKLITTVKAARYHHGHDFGMIVPFLYLNGGIA